MTMEGESPGSHHRNSWSRSLRGMLTQPEVGRPMSAWTNIADPGSGTTGSLL